jgi:hypothetical protein
VRFSDTPPITISTLLQTDTMLVVLQGDGGHTLSSVPTEHLRRPARRPTCPSCLAQKTFITAT